jgi:deoxycytidine triphosphate deaminase
MTEELDSALDFPLDAPEADQRFERFENVDPFPEIAPALLNSQDLYDYARVTGMVFPFPKGEDLRKKLKPASLEIDFLGHVYIRSEREESLPPSPIRPERIHRDQPFVLPKNSIAFVALETEFRLPHYIALRFNLRITHVHRGLLLGTGPLVDPGFVGRLLIPLHNLTSEDYTIFGGDGLIWVEFTKVSPNTFWHRKAPEVDVWAVRGRAGAGKLARFPADKRNQPPEYYFR